MFFSFPIFWKYKIAWLHYQELGCYLCIPNSLLSLKLISPLEFLSGYLSPIILFNNYFEICFVGCKNAVDEKNGVSAVKKQDSGV